MSENKSEQAEIRLKFIIAFSGEKSIDEQHTSLIGLFQEMKKLFSS